MSGHERDIGTAGADPWDIEGARRVLRAQHSSRVHPIYGLGHRFTLDEAVPYSPRVELYPERSLLRYRSNLLRIQLLQVERIEPHEDHLAVASAAANRAAQTLIYPDGTLTVAMLAASSAQQAPPLLPRLTEAVPPQAQREEPNPTPEKTPRLVLTGRVGRAAQLRETAKGQVIARVPLAVHMGEETKWHTLLFFNEVAKKAEELAKGQLITVVGYRHTRVVPAKGGGTRLVEEIYGVGIQNSK